MALEHINTDGSETGLSVANKTNAGFDAIDGHEADTANPHAVTAAQVGALTPDGDGSGLTGLTKSQVGLGNVDNTSDVDKPVSTAQQTALDAKVTKGTTYTSTPDCTTVETLTQADYDGITPDANTLYVIVG